MYNELTKQELELLIEQTKRDLTVLQRYYQKGDFSFKGFEKQINLLLDDLNELQRELDKKE